MVFLSIKCRICRYFLIQLLVCKMSWNLSLKFCFSGVGHYSAGTAGRYRKEKEGGRLLGGRKWPRLRGLCKKIAFWALSLLLSKYKAMIYAIHFITFSCHCIIFITVVCINSARTKEGKCISNL